MNTIRVNVQLPADLAGEIQRLSGRRKRNQFILEAIRRRVEEIRNEEVRQRLIQGYQSTCHEDLEITKDFEAVDAEGWDEY